MLEIATYGLVGLAVMVLTSVLFCVEMKPGRRSGRIT